MSLKELIQNKPRWLDKLIPLVIFTLTSLLLILGFHIRYPLLTVLLFVAEIQVMRLVFPNLFNAVWQLLAKRRVQLLILAISTSFLILWSTGILGAIAEARDAPENEFGSWGEWLNLFVGTFVATVNTIIAWQLYRVTRVLTVNTVVGEFLNKAMELAAPDGKVIDFTPMTCLLVTEKLAVVLNSPEGITSGDLAMIFKRLDGIYGLSILKYKAAAQQIDVDEAGLPIQVPYIDPRFEENHQETPKVVRLVRLDILAYLFEGRSMKGQYLKGVDLSWTQWCKFNFSETDLRNASFCFTTIKECNFAKANLIGTKFYLSSWEGTESRAKIEQSNFAGCTMELQTFNFLLEQGDEITRASLASTIVIDEQGNQLTSSQVLELINRNHENLKVNLLT